MAAAGAGGLVWSAAALDAYLADPKGYIKGNRMSFAGLRKEAERADVIAYLNAFSADGSSTAAPPAAAATPAAATPQAATARSEEHPYELQSLMRNSYSGFCL